MRFPPRSIRLFLFSLSSCFALCTAPADTYKWTTLFGDIGLGATDGTNTAARFYGPQALAADASGNVYVADTLNFTIRKMTRAGTNWITETIAGSADVGGSADGTNNGALFYMPVSIAVNSAGQLYVSERDSHIIREISRVGGNWVTRTIAGLAGVSGAADGIGSAARFSSPRGVAIEASGAIIVADSGNHTVRRIERVGTNWNTTTVAGFAGSAGSADGTNDSARFRFPEAICADSNGTVYVADSSNHTIRSITPDGEVSTVAGLAGSSGYADGLGPVARFVYPRGITLDATGTLFVAGSGDHTIRCIRRSGTNWIVSNVAGVTYSPGTRDGTNSVALFSSPFGIAANTEGDVFIADTGNHTIRKATLVGAGFVITTLAGVSSMGSNDGTNTSARFFQPAGIASDHAGGFFVSDTRNQVIRKVSRNGSDYVVTTVAGMVKTVGASDGLNSQARFYEPQGLVVDQAGTVYVADSGNNAIRRIAPVGTNWQTTTIIRFLSYPNSIALDTNGSLIIANCGDHTIRKLTYSGTTWALSTIAGQPSVAGIADGTNNSARFKYPNGVALDKHGRIYVADNENKTFREITPVGTNWAVTTVAGMPGQGGFADGTNTDARFGPTLGIAVDDEGDLYVSDNLSVRKITHSGTNWIANTIWPTIGGANTLLVESSENIYLADTRHNAIRLGEPLRSLRFTWSENQIVLSWPSSARDYILETSARPQQGDWNPVAITPVIVDRDFVVTNAIAPGSRFYRLRKQ